MMCAFKSLPHPPPPPPPFPPRKEEIEKRKEKQTKVEKEISFAAYLGWLKCAFFFSTILACMGNLSPSPQCHMLPLALYADP